MLPLEELQNHQRERQRREELRLLEQVQKDQENRQRQRQAMLEEQQKRLRVWERELEAKRRDDERLRREEEEELWKRREQQSLQEEEHYVWYGGTSPLSAEHYRREKEKRRLVRERRWKEGKEWARKKALVQEENSKKEEDEEEGRRWQGQEQGQGGRGRGRWHELESAHMNATAAATATVVQEVQQLGSALQQFQEVLSRTSPRTPQRTSLRSEQLSVAATAAGVSPASWNGISSNSVRGKSFGSPSDGGSNNISGSSSPATATGFESFEWEDEEAGAALAFAAHVMGYTPENNPAVDIPSLPVPPALPGTRSPHRAIAAQAMQEATRSNFASTTLAAPGAIPQEEPLAAGGSSEIVATTSEAASRVLADVAAGVGVNSGRSTAVEEGAGDNSGKYKRRLVGFDEEKLEPIYEFEFVGGGGGGGIGVGVRGGVGSPLRADLTGARRSKKHHTAKAMDMGESEKAARPPVPPRPYNSASGKRGGANSI